MLSSVEKRGGKVLLAVERKVFFVSSELEKTTHRPSGEIETCFDFGRR